MINKHKLNLSLLLGIIFIGFIINFFSSPNIKSIEAFITGVPLYLSISIFLFLYIVGTFFIWYLKDPLKIISAIFFGAYLSTLLIYIAETINAIILFSLSRNLGKNFVEKILTGRFKNIYEKLDKINLGWVFLLRIIPLIAFKVLDISFGLTKLSFKKYMAIVLAASLPRIFFFQFILAAVKGFSIEKMSIYIAKNPIIIYITFAYIIISCIVAFKIKHKLSD